ncbi:efflux RND transporter periplasmic adaptor subunit [Azonexus sp.]|uniref:efflux RND transporter periplasmic adaptor subunit n=1 Tax=Azonexus sp. TaxID=1872668 RepID=UPI0039E6BA40
MTLLPFHSRYALLWSLTTALGAFLNAPVQAQTTTRPATISTPNTSSVSKPGTLLACVILPIKTADIGTQVAGVVAQIEVERGDRVSKGQVLARMQAEVEQANSAAALTRAASEAEWRAAQAGELLALQKLRRQRTLAAKNFVSGQAVELAESEYRVALERVSIARDQRAVSAREAGSAAAQLSLRVLRAPFDGIVTERHANPGERFEEKPLFRVADISRLRVDVVASSALFGRIKPGQLFTVHPELPDTAPRTAKVVQIDQVLDPASNTFRLRLEMNNHDASLPAGLRCRAEPETPLPGL